MPDKRDRTNQWLFAVLLALQFLAVPVANSSGAMRCGTELVEQGATKAEVLKLCGEPTSIIDSENTWIYAPDGQILVHRLRFAGDILQFVDDVPPGDLD